MYILEATENLNSRHLGLIWAKQFEHNERRGLFKQSLLMTNLVIVFEDKFKSEIDQIIKSMNVRHEMAARLHTLPCCNSIKDHLCDCMTVDYIVLMYITIRLHHELKLRNRGFKELKANRRAAKKIAKLQHQ